MSNTSAYGYGRPQTPAPGVDAPERRIARMRPVGAGLFWSALLLIAVCGATGYFLFDPPFGLPIWVIPAVAAIVIVLLVVLPYLAWSAHTYTITTRRVIERSGLLSRTHREVGHTRGYAITVRRGLWQRLWRAGTIELASGTEKPLVLRGIRDVNLVHEVLVDQVEVGQILAHRDSHTTGETL